MIQLYVSTSLKAEFAYITSVIFTDFFGLEYEIHAAENAKHIELRFENKCIRFNADFWQLENYLHLDNLPKNVILHQNKLLPETDLPLLYGEDFLEETPDCINCGPDLFASCYFMLSRWEEYVVSDRDKHNRFPAQASCAQRFDFLDRPIVNEMLEFLWNMLQKLGFKPEQKIQQFEVFATHDIDHLSYWSKTKRKKIGQHLIGDLVKRKKPVLVIRRLKSYFISIIRKKDPADSFSYLINLAHKRGFKSVFYFIAGGNTSYEKNYPIGNIETKNTLDFLAKNKVEIGLHPSYESSVKPELIKQEKLALEQAVQHTVSESRQHYLRLSLPQTFVDLQQAGIKTDSSLYYSGFPGFRCGICHEFKVFDFLTKTVLEIRERPLLVMDTCLSSLSESEMEHKVQCIKRKVEKYKGKFVFLWHNTNIFTPEWIDKQKKIEELFYGKPE